MAGFDYKTNLDSVVDALKDYNTSTSSPFLSDGLTTRVDKDNIQSGDPSIAMIRTDRVPAIWVRVANSQEEFASIGVTGPSGNRKYKTVTYDIFAMYAREGGHNRHTSALDEIYKLVQNIEAVFQAELRLSNTALWCQTKNTALANVPLDAEGASWIKTAMIELEARYFFR